MESQCRVDEPHLAGAEAASQPWPDWQMEPAEAVLAGRQLPSSAWPRHLCSRSYCSPCAALPEEQGAVVIQSYLMCMTLY